MANETQNSPRLAPIFKSGKKRGISSNNSTPNSKKVRGLNEQNLSNNFSILSDNGDMDAEMALLQASKLRHQAKKVTKPMPPIIITQGLKQPKETHQKIQSWVNNAIYFKIKAGNTEIITSTVDDHTTIQSRLKEVQIEFITSAPPNTQNKRMVLKGIDKNYSIDDIITNLRGQGLNIIKAEQLLSKKTGTSSDRNPCAVWFSPDTNIAFVTRNIKYCCHYRVQWSKFMQPRINRVLQCFRCQSPGHKAQFCGKRYRCVKCIGVHEPGQCPKKEDDKPRCVNCQLFHPANYHGCIILKEFGKNSHPNRAAKPTQIRNRQNVFQTHKHTITRNLLEMITIGTQQQCCKVT